MERLQTGRVAEVVTGESWDEAFAERVSGPLAMERTDYEGLGDTDDPVFVPTVESVTLGEPRPLPASIRRAPAIVLPCCAA